MSDINAVKEFTEQSMGIACPTKPIPMSRDAAHFITKMVISEMNELLQTVAHPGENVLDTMKTLVDRSDIVHSRQPPATEAALIAEQADSFVDAYYYMLNAACKHGMNLAGIFNVVHEANMNKRHADGKFHRRDDGKVIKPDNWKEADVVAEVQRQLDNGSWC